MTGLGDTWLCPLPAGEHLPARGPPPRPSHGAATGVPAGPCPTPPSLGTVLCPLCPWPGDDPAVPKRGQLRPPRLPRVPGGGSRGLRTRRGRGLGEAWHRGHRSALAFKPPPRATPGCPAPSPVARIRRRARRAAQSPIVPSEAGWGGGRGDTGTSRQALAPSPGARLAPLSLASAPSPKTTRDSREATGTCCRGGTWGDGSACQGGPVPKVARLGTVPPHPPTPPNPRPPLRSMAELPGRTSPGLGPAAHGVTVTVTGGHGATSTATAPQSPAHLPCPAARCAHVHRCTATRTRTHVHVHVRTCGHARAGAETCPCAQACTYTCRHADVHAWTCTAVPLHACT